MKLNDLMPNEGAKKVGKRKGHGISAGQGKTAGRGTKGLGASAGSGGHLYRQGGNLPFFRRLPFMRGEGFTTPSRVEFNEVNLDKLARFKAGSVISQATLAEAKMLHKPGHPVVILGRGELKVALTIQVQRVTDSARAKIESAGGKIELIA